MTTVETRPGDAERDASEFGDHPGFGRVVDLLWAGLPKADRGEPPVPPAELAASAPGHDEDHRALGRLVILAGRQLLPMSNSPILLAEPPRVVAARRSAAARDAVKVAPAVAVVDSLRPVDVPVAPPPQLRIDTSPPISLTRPRIGEPARVKPVVDPPGLPQKQARQARTFFWVEMIGMLTLLFVVYQLWGTTFEQHKSQERLRAAYQKANSAGTATSSNEGVTIASPGAATGPPIASTVPLMPGGAVARLEIPAIHVDQFVVEGTGEDALKRGPGHYTGSPVPGQPGNVAIAGHRTTYGAPFSRLDELKPGDAIVATTTAGRFLYVVSHELVVAPGQTSVVDDYGDSRLTLTTCTPKFLATQRLIAVAILKGPAPAASAPVRVVAPPPVASRPVTTAGPAAASLRDRNARPDLAAFPFVLLLGALIAALRPLHRTLRRRRSPRLAGVVVGTTGLVLSVVLAQQLARVVGLNASAMPLALAWAGLMAGLGLLYRPARRALPPLATAVVLAPFWLLLTMLLFEQLTRLLPPNV